MTEDTDSGAHSESPPDLGATLDDLDVIIDRARAGGSAIGIFPSMYRSVTAEIRDAVHGGFFDDNETMERLAVVFADRYLDAYNSWARGERPTRSWLVAFNAATDGRRRMIAQHLLAGMNAHINLDLGIVAAAIAGDDPETVYGDFLRVNQILFQKLNGLQDSLGSVSSRMAWIDRLGGRMDERMMTLAIRDARGRAWDLATDLIAHPQDVAGLIDRRDRDTAELGRTIVGGAMPIRMLSRFVARSEPTDVREVLDAFAEQTVDLNVVESAVRLDLETKRGAV